MQRPARVGPVALVPPRRGVDAQRAQPLERGEPAPGLDAAVGELAAPGRGRLAHAHRLVERYPRAPGVQVTPSSSTNRERCVSSSASGCMSAATSTTRRRARPTTIRNSRRSSSRRSRFRSDRLRTRSQRGQVEHRLGARQRREVPLGGARHEHRVELLADRAVGREHLNGVGLRPPRGRSTPGRARRRRAPRGTPPPPRRPVRRPRQRRWRTSTTVSSSRSARLDELGASTGALPTGP